jgi:1-acyl-sn-glycerol-3-phosphate acyltransferase
VSPDDARGASPAVLPLSWARWGLGSLLAAGCFLAIILGSYLVPVQRLHGFARAAFRLGLRVVGLRFRVRGLEALERLPAGRGCLIMANHVNRFDPFLIVAALPCWVVALESASNFRVPLYGWLIRRWGNRPIDRADTASAIATLGEARALLAAGRALVVMPEGSRSRSGRMEAFKKGGFHLAIEAGAPILPIALRGYYAHSPIGSRRLTLCEAEVVIGQPIDAAAYAKEDLPALMEAVRAAIAGALEGPAEARAVVPAAAPDAEPTQQPPARPEAGAAP